MKGAPCCSSFILLPSSFPRAGRSHTIGGPTGAFLTVDQMSGFLTDQELSDRLDALLRPAAGEARPDYWASSQALADSNAFAWGIIRTALGGLGYSTTQVLLWGEGKIAQVDMALWRLATLGVIATDLSDVQIAALDRRQEIAAMTSIPGSDGLPLPPDNVPGAMAGVVGHGQCFSSREKAGLGAMRTS